MELQWKNKNKSLYIDYENGYKISWVSKEDIIVQDIPKLISNGSSEPIQGLNSVLNSIILGDNLFVLNALIDLFKNVPDDQKIKFVYIDPPYNTLNPELTYRDNLGHEEWLSFMQDRLERVKQLLRPDGIICVQIDDREYARLYLLMIDLFNEKNLKTIVVKMSESSGLKMQSAKSGGIPKLKEYLILAKMDGIQGFKFESVPKDHWDPEYNIFIKNFTQDERKKLDLFINYKKNLSSDEVNEIDAICKKFELVNINGILEEEKVPEINKIEFLNSNAWRICRTAASKSVFKLTEEKKRVMKEKQQVFSVVSPTNKVYLVKSNYNEKSTKPRVQILFANDHTTTTLGDLWTDIKTTGLESEGEINFKNGKKPEKLIRRLIQGTTFEMDVVLDLFSGSGTVLSVALEMNRNCIGIEVDKKIYQLAIQRLEKKLLTLAKERAELFNYLKITEKTQ